MTSTAQVLPEYNVRVSLRECQGEPVEPGVINLSPSTLRQAQGKLSSG